MVYKNKIKSLKSLSLRFWLSFFIIMTMVILLSFTSFLFGVSYYNSQKNSAYIKSLNQKVKGVLDPYQYEIISIAAQPIFSEIIRANQAMIVNYLSKSNQYFDLERQISRFTAQYQKNTIFSGSKIIGSDGTTKISIPPNKSKFFIKIPLCYMDSSLSFISGSTCEGYWLLYIDKEKLKNILSKSLLISEARKNNYHNVSIFFNFPLLKGATMALPQQIYIARQSEDDSFFNFIYYPFIGLFILLLLLVFYIKKLYTVSFLYPIQQLDKYVSTGQGISEELEINSPKEIRKLISAIRLAVNSKKIDAISEIAHDLKTPLQRLRDFSKRIPTKYSRECINLHNTFYLSISTPFYKELDSVNLYRFLSDCIRSVYQEECNKNIIKIVCEKEIFSKISCAQMNRCIINLIDNSLRALNRIEKPLISISIYSDNSNNFIQIHDNGLGVSDYQLNHICDEGVSYSGSSGKGLFFCKKSLERIGGKISYRSKKDKGFEVVMQLPISNPQFDYINTIFYSGATSTIVILTDNSRIFSNLNTQLNIKRIKRSVDIHKIIKTCPNAVFLIDCSNRESNGISIIKKYNLIGRSYLITDSEQFLKSNYQEIRHLIPIFSKEHLSEIKFKDVDKYNNIFIDDDIEILRDVSLIAKNTSISLLPLNNFLQLSMCLKFLNKDCNITLDNKIDKSPISGIEMCNSLINKGFLNVAIQTGDEISVHNYAKGQINILEKGSFLKHGKQ